MLHKKQLKKEEMEMEGHRLLLEIAAIEDLDRCGGCGEPVQANLPCPYCTGEYHELEA